MRVTMYLLRPRAKLSKEALRPNSPYVERRLRPPPDESVSWQLYVHPGVERDPRWLDHVRPLLATIDDDRQIRSRSAGAVLLVRAYERIFAVTFGTGFHAVHPALIEPDFGLKVAANSIEPDEVTLADARGLGKGRRNATSRLPTPNEVFALGLLTDEEWIRRFGGHVKLDGFAKTASGADSLQLNIEDFSLLDLPNKIGQALELYQSEEYLKSFPFLNYFRRESDKQTVSELDALLTEHLRQRDQDVGFALPDEYNLHADQYRLSRQRQEKWLSELLTKDVYQAIDFLGGWKDPLKQVKVNAYDSSDNVITDREPLRTYAVGSVRKDFDGRQRDYAITAGAWFRIDQEYVELVDRYIADNVVNMTSDLDLPAWNEQLLIDLKVPGKYGEIRYNNWVGDQRGYCVLDRELYRGKAGERVEVCDLLTADKKLICVKRMDGSDSMSHLFQQGSVSAQMLMVNDEYRAKVMERLRTIAPGAEFGSAPDWTVVYAIATSKPGDLEQVMYFFARAALKMHGESLKSRGFKVAIAKIHRE